MKKWISLLAIVMTAGLVQATMIDFNSKAPVPGDGYYRPTTDGSHDWQDGHGSFNMDVTFGGGAWAGFTYSDVNDTTTAGYLNQYAVYGAGSGTGFGGSGAYAVGYMDSYGGVSPTLSFASGQRVNSIYVNNTTYAALDMHSGSGFSTAFTTDDWFRLSVKGTDSLGASLTQEFNLADFTGYSEGDNKDDYMVNEWTKVDLTSLGNDVVSLEFTVASSQSGTPSYFAIDQIDAIPEPSSVVLLVGGFGGLVWFRRRRKYFFQS